MFKMPEWKLKNSKSFDNYPTNITNLHPNIKIEEVTKEAYRKFYGTHMMPLPYMNIDTETWRDANKPAFFTGTIVYVDSEREWKTTTTSKKKWNRCDKHSKTKNNKRMEKCSDCNLEILPCKNKGKAYSVLKAGSEEKIVKITWWCWPEDLESLVIPLWDKYGGKKPAVYAHNLAFDIIPIMLTFNPSTPSVLHLFKAENVKDTGRLIIKGSKVMMCKYDLARHFPKGYSRKVYDRKLRKTKITKNRYIEFKDSLSLICSPLSDIGLSIEYTKGKTPAKFINANHPDFGIRNNLTKEDIGYGILDVDVLYYGMINAWNVFKDIGYKGKAWSLTNGTLGSQIIAQQNQKVGIENRIYKKKKDSWKYETIVNNKDLDDICRKALVGGRVQTFRTDEIHAESYGIDAKSMYPSQMTNKNNVFPDYRHMKGVDDMEEMLDLKRKGWTEGAIYVKWQRPNSDKIGYFSGRNEEDNLDWEMEKGERWITMLEYRFALKLGYTIKPLWDKETEYMAILCHPLSYNPFGIIKEMYDARCEKKKKGDKTEFYLKILMNGGGYGKFVEQNYDTFLTDDEGWASMPDCDEFKLGTKYNTEDRLGWAVAEKPKRGTTCANILGSYITAYARNNLYMIGQQIGHEHLLYCDTDSWKHTNSKLICPDEGNQLGDWVHENTHDYWHGVKPKQYKMHIIGIDGKSCKPHWSVKIKGVNMRSATQIWLKNNPTKTEQDYLKSVSVNGIFEYETLVGIKMGMRLIDYNAGDWKTVIKQA